MEKKKKKKKKKTVLLVGGLILLIIVIGTVIGVVVYKSRKDNYQSEEKQPDSETELSAKEKAARQEYQETFFKNNPQGFEKSEKEIETSTVKPQLPEGEFTPKNYANWLRKVITEQLKGQLHPTFPHNSTE